MPLTLAVPTFLAAAMVCSSIVAANASGVVPGTKFATVRPKPPPTNERREMSSLPMTFLPFRPLRPCLDFTNQQKGPVFLEDRPDAVSRCALEVNLRPRPLGSRGSQQEQANEGFKGIDAPS